MSSTLRSRMARSLGFGLGRHVSRRQGRALAEEELLQVLHQDFLILRAGGIQPVLVEHHLAVLAPHLPGFLRDVLVDAAAELGVERRFVEARHLALELHAEYGAFARSLGHRWSWCAAATHRRSSEQISEDTSLQKILPRCAAAPPMARSSWWPPPLSEPRTYTRCTASPLAGCWRNNRDTHAWSGLPPPAAAGSGSPAAPAGR